MWLVLPLASLLCTIPVVVVVVVVVVDEVAQSSRASGQSFPECPSLT